MFKTKIVEIFCALSRKEQRSLCRWVHSPAHNSRHDVQQLCQYLYENTAKERSLLQKEKVFAALYGAETPFDERQLHYVCSYLLKQIDNFLIYNNQVAREDWAQLHLAKAYRRLGLGDTFKKTMDTLRKSQSSKAIKDANFHAVQYQIELEDFVFMEQQNRSNARDLQQMVLALDVQYIAEKLKQACFVAARETVYKAQYDKGLLPFVLAYIHQHPALLDVPAIGLYYYYYNINTTENPSEKEQYFELFSQLLYQYAPCFEPAESRDLYMLAINFSIRRYNTNGSREEHLQATFALYKAALQGGFLLENQRMSPFTFKNIAGTAMRLGELEWAEQFIRAYVLLLPAKDSETYEHYAFSKLAFTRKNYQEAILRLQKVEYSDIFLNLDAKIMLMKIYYELGEYDALEAFLQSFNAFLRRKTQLGYHRDNYKNTLSFIQKLLLRSPISPEKKEKLRHEIEQTSALGEKEWLLKQLETYNV